MKSVVFHPEAKQEMLGAAEFYGSRSSGLGERFHLEVERGLTAICESPARWPVLERKVRRYLLHSFPYGLLYGELPDRIVVVAVMHLHREPGYWKSRL